MLLVSLAMSPSGSHSASSLSLSNMVISFPISRTNGRMHGAELDSYDVCIGLSLMPDQEILDNNGSDKCLIVNLNVRCFRLSLFNA